MRKFLILAALISVSQAKCPDMGQDAFKDILHNKVHHTIFGNTDYIIQDRVIPDFAVESKKKPRINVRKNGRACHYTRKIGDVNFGSFKLVREHENKMVIVERARPDVVIVEQGPHHRHHRHHHR